MRTLAIDLGSKRIGLAISDAGGTIANPIEVIAVSSPELALDPIAKLVEREGVQRIIVGLPLNMDDSTSRQTQKTIAWTNLLRNRVTVPILYVDERLSSFEAEQQLVDRKRGGEKITRKSKKQMLDALVAANLLQEFLDGKLPAIDAR